MGAGEWGSGSPIVLFPLVHAWGAGFPPPGSWHLGPALIWCSRGSLLLHLGAPALLPFSPRPVCTHRDSSQSCGAPGASSSSSHQCSSQRGSMPRSMGQH